MGNLGSWFSTEVGLGLLRNILMAAGASLVTQGVLNQGQLTDVVGALAVIAGVIISAIANKNKAHASAVVAAVNANSSLITIPSAGGGKPVILVKAPPSDMPPPSLSSTN